MHLGLKKRKEKKRKRKKNGLERAVSLCENSSKNWNREILGPNCTDRGSHIRIVSIKASHVTHFFKKCQPLANVLKPLEPSMYPLSLDYA